jgi:hypothetical protein
MLRALRMGSSDMIVTPPPRALSNEAVDRFYYPPPGHGMDT